jgi:hypothetical protein
MKNDYLWDRSGEPDPEIQELEEILGTLKYQPRPLEIPARLTTGRYRAFFPGFAIAASILMVLLGVSLWLGWHRRHPVVLSTNESPAKATDGSRDNVIISQEQPKVTISTESPKAKERIATSPHNQVAHNTTRDRHLRSKIPSLTPEERAEAQAAKEQLMLALRVASAKFNLAQRRTQTGYPQNNMIRNQHKIG